MTFTQDAVAGHVGTVFQNSVFQRPLAKPSSDARAERRLPLLEAIHANAPFILRLARAAAS